MKLFSYNNPILSCIRRMVDYFFVSLLWIIASIPVITGGAAFVAALQTIQISIRKDGEKVFQTFWKQFRAEFKQATTLWLLELALLVLLFLNFCIIRDNEMLLLFKVLGYAACFVGFLWLQLWPGYLSSFEDDTKTLLHNTFRIALSSTGRTLVAAVLPFSAFIIAYVSFFTTSLLLFIVPACYLFLYSALMRKLFSRYLSTEAKENLVKTY